MTLPKWCEVMPQVLGLSLQWLTLQPMLCALTEDHRVDYNEFLGRYDVEYEPGEGGDAASGKRLREEGDDDGGDDDDEAGAKRARNGAEASAGTVA